MKNDLVSIIVPVYNAEASLKKCIESLLIQDYSTIEIFLIDDGSTDNSGVIADELAVQNNNITVVHQFNHGRSNARNVGIRLASGKYICFVDSDDTVAKDFVSSLVDASKDGSFPVCGIKYHRLFANTEQDIYLNSPRAQRKNEPLVAYIPYLLATDGRMYSSVNKCYLKKVITENNLTFSEDLDFAEDTKFVLDYLKYADSNIKFILKPLYIYNFGTEGSTTISAMRNWSDWKKSYHNLREWAGKNPGFRARFWMRMVWLRWRISYLRTKLGRARN